MSSIHSKEDHNSVAVALMFSAKEVHCEVIKTFRIGNRVRRQLIELLLGLYETKLYLLLGSPSIVEYAEKHLKYHKSQTYDFLRVARAIRTLPKLLEAFDRGEINWSILLEVTKVAEPETEEEWLAFAKTRSSRLVKRAVGHAVKEKRKKPADESHGLPNIEVVLPFSLTAERHELYVKAATKVAREIEQSLPDSDGAKGAPRITPEDVLLYMCEMVLGTDPVNPPPGRRDREESMYMILIQQCVDCRRSQVITDDGPVQVDPEVVERVKPDAEIVTIEPEDERLPDEEVPEANKEEMPETETETEIETETEKKKKKMVPPEERDKKNTPYVVRRVQLRDGRTCSNPHCHRKLGCHAHHIEFRCFGGKTILSNETLVCPVCHSLLHLGLLEIEGNPLDGLRWTCAADHIEVDFSGELELLASLGIGELPEAIAAAADGADSGRPESAGAARPDSGRLESADEADEAVEDLQEDAEKFLSGFGCSKKKAKRYAKRAVQGLVEQLRRLPTPQETMQEAFRRWKEGRGPQTIHLELES
jgi:hypothetical protein